LFSGLSVSQRKAYTDQSNDLVGFMSKEWIKIDSESTFNGGSFGCTVGLRNRSSNKGRFKWIWLFVLKYLNIVNKNKPGLKGLVFDG
jgi:hypothetical protein